MVRNEPGVSHSRKPSERLKEKKKKRESTASYEWPISSQAHLLCWWGRRGGMEGLVPV